MGSYPPQRNPPLLDRRLLRISETWVSAMTWMIIAAAFLIALLVVALLWRRKAAQLVEIELDTDALPEPLPNKKELWEAPTMPSYPSNKIVPSSILRLLEPMASWHDEELAVFAPEHRSDTYPPGFLLFERGELTDQAFYLLKGEVELKFELREPAVFRAEDPESRYPLGTGSRFPVTCISRTEVEMLRVPRALLKTERSKLATQGIDTSRMTIPPVLASSSAFHTFCRSFDSGSIELPALPQVALRLRQMLQDPDVDIDDVAKLVQVDPALSAKLIHVANSPLYLSAQPISTCHAATVRLGLEATKNIVFCLGLRQMFSATHGVVKRKAQQVWEHSLTVSAMASVMAAQLASMDPDKALLAGLIYRIGAIPFLRFVDQLPADSYTGEEIDAALGILTGPVGSYVLREWNFPEEYQELPTATDHWFADSGERIDLADLLRLAVWHARLAEGGRAELPPIIALPCYDKLESQGLTADFSLDLLRQAQAQVAGTRRILAD